MLAAIFAIGMFFGVLFHRSGNLWIVGFFHGVGNWFAVGLTTLGPTTSSRP
jgi:membrane protease YdiL (CAAX protease family)